MLIFRHAFQLYVILQITCHPNPDCLPFSAAFPTQGPTGPLVQTRRPVRCNLRISCGSTPSYSIQKRI